MREVQVKVACYRGGSLRKATMRLPGIPVPVTVRPTPSVTYICPETLSDAQRMYALDLATLAHARYLKSLRAR
jgi:hypothetical protein